MAETIKQRAKGRQRANDRDPGQMENLVPSLGSRWQRQTDRQAGSKHNGISVDASINAPLKA